MKITRYLDGMLAVLMTVHLPWWMPQWNVPARPTPGEVRELAATLAASMACASDPARQP